MSMIVLQNLFMVITQTTGVLWLHAFDSVKRNSQTITSVKSNDLIVLQNRFVQVLKGIFGVICFFDTYAPIGIHIHPYTYLYIYIQYVYWTAHFIYSMGEYLSIAQYLHATMHSYNKLSPFHNHHHLTFWTPYKNFNTDSVCFVSMLIFVFIIHDLVLTKMILDIICSLRLHSK